MSGFLAFDPNSEALVQNCAGRKTHEKRLYSISVTSGKGGVGKTLTTVNLAIAARRMGIPTLILDGDFGLANVDVVLGLASRYNIHDVLDGNARLRDIVLDGPMGIGLIPSGSGVTGLTSLNIAQKQYIFDQIDGLPGEYELLLIDTGAGINETVMHLNKAAQRTLVVTTPEPHAMTDAYAMVKVLAEDHGFSSVDLLVNQTRSPDEGLKVAERIADVAMRFLKVRVNHVGCVPHDPQLVKAVMQRRAASADSARTVAGQAWTQIARQLLGRERPARNDGVAVEDLWRHLLAERTGPQTVSAV